MFDDNININVDSFRSMSSSTMNVVVTPRAYPTITMEELIRVEEKSEKDSEDTPKSTKLIDLIDTDDEA